MLENVIEKYSNLPQPRNRWEIGKGNVCRRRKRMEKSQSSLPKTLGKVPSELKEVYERDGVELVADEIRGKEIAQYLGGTLALFEFYRCDRNKYGILKELPPFLDDAIAGLLSGIMVRLFQK
ncbi:MAG TPA: hypothetical protein ENG13_05150 [bacterium]|nr:hypothetical protein [bacterium]HEX68427.1 hypothetical protein [bacterium]